MIFIDNKYTRWYYNIIAAAQSRVNAGYTEKHHIIPKSCGGSNSKENLVVLTAREHYVCHILLTKMIEGKYRYKMGYALNRMLTSTDDQQRYIPTSRKFEIVRLRISNTLKGHPSPMTGKVHNEESKKKMSDAGKGKPSKLKGIPKSEETKKKMSEARMGYKMPDGTKKKLSEANIGKTCSEETKKKISEKSKGHGAGIPKSEEHKKKLSEAWKGRVVSQETIEKMKNAPRPIFTPEEKLLIAAKISKAHKGKTISESAKEQKRLTLANKPVVKCPYCDYEKKDSASFRKWHYDNCKMKKLSD